MENFVTKKFPIFFTDVKLEETNSEGYVFRAANRHEPNINKKFDVISIKRACINFTSEKMRSLNSGYLQSLEEYEEQAMAIVKQMLSVVSTYSKYMTQLGELTGTLDGLVGLASAAVNSPEPWTRPQFSNEITLNLTGLRHPLLEQGATEVVSNDVTLTHEKRLMILTGPNMGGKSTYLRSAAVAIILAQMGSFVPAEEAELSIFDSIITRIGATDNLARGVSTFLHEMSECESIFRQATEKSFVIIDELGRGTSTWDGFGLAWAIADNIATEIKCLSIFATHYHEMASLETKNQFVFNMHTKVHVDDEKVTHLYQVEKGASSTSYGIEIAKLAGFPEKSLKRSRELAEKSSKIECVLTSQTNYADRKEATEVLAKIIKLAKENKSNLSEKRAEILKLASESNSSIVQAALKV